jgi:uncharacterized protein (TIGR02300 family)
VARPELGTKRVCPTTGRKFYDLNKSPIISPYTGQVVAVAAPALARGGRSEPAPARPSPAVEEAETESTEDAELISLEEADDEAAGGKSAPAEDDVEIEDDTTTEDDTFLEEDEDSDDDVTDLIGDGIEDDEEP